jgi:hypothetical protein
MKEKLFLPIFFLFLFFSLSYSQQTNTFPTISKLPNADTQVTLTWTQPGSFSFTAPDTGIYHIQVWGAGGGVSGPVYAPAGSSGGGGGSYVSGDINIDKGVEIDIGVGNGSDGPDSLVDINDGNKNGQTVNFGIGDEIVAAGGTMGLL